MRKTLPKVAGEMRKSGLGQVLCRVVVFAGLVGGGVVQRVHVCEEEKHLRPQGPRKNLKDIL